MRILASTLLFFLLTATANASGTKVYDSDIPGVAIAGDIFVAGAWTRQSPPGVDVGAAYMRIKNNGEKSDRLLSAEVMYADEVEIHMMGMKDGVMSMSEVEDGLEIESGTAVVFEPGSYHLMVKGMTEGPMAGDIVTFMLEFEKAGLVNILMPVAPIGAKGPQN